jgi:hypothetical protein
MQFWIEEIEKLVPYRGYYNLSEAKRGKRLLGTPSVVPNIPILSFEILLWSISYRHKKKTIADKLKIKYFFLSHPLPFVKRCIK